ncbi:SGNH/GDSL hydrolase family protein [Nocardioides KLBMP 9356]|uniref:SGNH/GDSL hydrolase family protein n=1 Tax=Nocardioides potassii TaxID=2911371 RepID=A0ABS9HCR4_9ACTN|nr:SGNH/GDSL hydrolase family protein [Nocardioides potassii]MCF6378004.1 SGNH/GDSL hydrolase family protein [Nocardioides potassii]
MSTSAIRFAVLGDSIAWGQGAARDDERLGPRLQRGLEDHGIALELGVFAVPGARSRGLAPQVDRALSWRPDLVLVVIGANDLTHREPVADAVRALAGAVGRLREAGAEVVVAPAPDLGAVPHVPVSLREIVRAASEDLRRRQAAAVEAEGGHVADADGRTSTAFAADPAMFSADRFHPSSAGYAVIADAVLPAILQAARVRGWVNAG